MPKRLNVWKKATSTYNLEDFRFEFLGDDKRVLKIMTTFQVPSIASNFEISYTVNTAGEIHVDNHLALKKNMPVMPRYGNNLMLNKSFDKVTWLGRGPHENYQDRKTAAFFGEYKASVSELYFPYIRPQENGYRTDVNVLKFQNKSGYGLKLSSNQPFGFSAHHQFNNDFDPGSKKRQRHTTDIVERDFVNLNIDYKQMGVGGDNSWGAMPLKKYRITKKDLSFDYVIAPYFNS